MNKYNILIFEDEWPTIKGSFEMSNIADFNNNLIFKIKTKSQDYNLNNLSNDAIEAVFIDITLAKKSQMDGFSLIKEIIENKIIDMKKVFIMTGNGKVKEKLQEMGLDTEVINILKKPVSFIDISSVLKSIIVSK